MLGVEELPPPAHLSLDVQAGEDKHPCPLGLAVMAVLSITDGTTTEGTTGALQGEWSWLNHRSWCECS